MKANSGGPQAEHPPEGQEDSNRVGCDEHSLGLQLEVSLDIPEDVTCCDRADGLNDVEIGRLEEGEFEEIILDDADERSRGVDAVGDEECGHKVEECKSATCQRGNHCGNEIAHGTRLMWRKAR